MTNKSPDIENSLQYAIKRHQEGDLQDALKIYKEILAKDPEHSEALHLLGFLSHQCGNNKHALHLIKKAVLSEPKNPHYRNSLGLVLKEMGETDEAISEFREAIRLKLDFAGAFNNLGLALQAKKEMDEAIVCFERALYLNKNLPEVHNNLGNAFRSRGMVEKAENHYQQAVALNPNFSNAYCNLGSLYQSMGRINDALYSYQKAIILNPNVGETYYNLGTLFYKKGMMEKAIYSYQKATELELGSAELYYNLGMAQEADGQLDTARLSYEKALQFNPQYAEVYNNLGNILKDEGKKYEAIDLYEKTLTIDPDFGPAYHNIGAIYQSLGEVDKSIIYYQNALNKGESNIKTLSQLILQLKKICHWEDIEKLTAKLEILVKDAIDKNEEMGALPYISIALFSKPHLHQAIARARSEEIIRKSGGKKRCHPVESRIHLNKKIRLAYLSNDFRSHPVSHLISGLFKLHDRNDFEVFCYSTGEDDASIYRKRIERECDHFIDIRDYSDQSASSRILDDQIDILIDLMGHTRGSRLGISALRVAPIQVNYLGFPGTTGADFMDYIIVDKIITPIEDATLYNEKFIYMPNCYLVADNSQAISKKEFVRGDFGLPEESFIFCSFNQTIKIESTMFNTWMKILHQVPGSILWLSSSGLTAEKNLKMEAEKREIAGDRLIFAEKMPAKEDHLSRISLADLALDTQYYNGHTTTVDSLWAGTPVIALKGNSFASRVSSSCLAAAGMPEMITTSLNEYETLAVELAGNKEKIHALRKKLAIDLNLSPLFDTTKWVKQLEWGLREIWHTYVASEEPHQIVIPA